MSEMLQEPVADGSAWKATDYENDDSWIYGLARPNWPKSTLPRLP